MNIYENLARFAAKNSSRFFMPGHKGRAVDDTFFSPVLPYDVTELHDTDDLMAPKGVIRESQDALARLFKTGGAHYLTGGATLGIYASLSMCRAREKCGEYVVLDRGCHKSVLDAMILLSLEPRFLPCCTTGHSTLTAVCADDVRKELKNCPDAAAVIITTPSYYGVCSDISEILKVAHEFDTPLIIDAAHGGNLLFSDGPDRLLLSSDFTIVSLHKTLPALTGAALLFSNGYERDEITRHIALYSTSSPSHLILASAERCVTFMAGEGRLLIPALKEKCLEFESWLSEHTPLQSVHAENADMTRICIFTRGADIDGYTLYDELYRRGVICEMADEENVVLIPSVATNDNDFMRLKEALSDIRISRKYTPVAAAFSYAAPEMAMSMRSAFFAPHEAIACPDSENRVCAQTLTRYPPGIPYLVPGQRITRLEADVMRVSGIKKVLVVK